jgi:hypothetical protein
MRLSLWIAIANLIRKISRSDEMLAPVFCFPPWNDEGNEGQEGNEDSFGSGEN